MAADAFHVKLLPAVAVFSIRRISILFPQGSHVRFILQVTRIDARARCIKIALDAISSCRFDRLQIHQRIIANDLGLVAFNEPDATHVSRESVNFIDAFRRLQTVLRLRQIQKGKFVRSGSFVLRLFHIGAAHPIAMLNQILRQMVANKTTRAGHQYSHLFGHRLQKLLII